MKLAVTPSLVDQSLGRRKAAWILSAAVLGLLLVNRVNGLTDGVWTDAASGGLWSSSGNWLNGAIAAGTDGTADFSQLDITVDNIIYINNSDTARTIGHLIFGDTVPSNNWIVTDNGGGDSLKLAVTSYVPTIAVNNTTVNIISTLSGGTQGFDKQGNGTLILSAANGNNISGNVKVSGGTLQLGNTLVLKNCTLDYNSYGGTLSLGAVTNATLGGLQGNQNLALFNGATGVALSIGNNNQSTSYSGALSGSGSLMKVGSGTLTLSGFDNYSGGTTIANGTLQGDTNSLAGNIANYGSVVFSQTFDGIYSGSISGTGDLAATGGGTISMTGANSYSGRTTVSSGLLILNNANALPGGIGTTGGVSSLTIAGGVIGLATGDFTRPLGTSAGAVGWTTSGGFSAQGADRIVNIGGAASQVHWNNSQFVPTGSALILSAPAATNTVTFQNPIDLNGAIRAIEVDDGAALVDAVLSSALSGSSAAGLSKIGSGTLALNAADTYSGATTVAGGLLLLNNSAALPGGTATAGGTSALTLGGGSIGLGAGDFLRGLGTGANQVQWTGSGGFSAHGTDRIVNLGGASAPVHWSTGSFIPTGSALILGAVAATNTLTFQNPIDLNGAIRTIHVDKGAAMIDAVISSPITSSGVGGFVKTGAGTLSLGGPNAYSGGTTVNGGLLLLNNATALPGGTGTAGGTSSLTINGGVVGLGAGDFLRGLGAGPDQVQWTGSGGFAAAGADRVVNLGGAGAQVQWGAGGFVPNGSTLILGSVIDPHTVDFQNPIDLAGGVRTIEFDGNATLSGAISDSMGGGSLVKTGGGTLTLAADNSWDAARRRQIATLRRPESGARLHSSVRAGSYTRDHHNQAAAPVSRPSRSTE
jgi:autotransporter-associated beta strand protein